MRTTTLFLLLAAILSGPAIVRAQPILLDMVHHNCGEPPFESKFLNPDTLVNYGYTGQVFSLFEAAQFGISYEALDPNIFPEGSDGRRWIEAKSQAISNKYEAAKNAGLSVYCQMDMIVLPKTLKTLYGQDICNGGRIDIHEPKTQDIIRFLLQSIFREFPQLDGIVVRTGETYLHDAPYFTGNNPVLKGPESHIVLLQLLRDEVCVKLDKRLFYRTWDFGYFHSQPDYYLKVTDAIAPHPNLVFSIKHTTIDFWRGAPQQSDNPIQFKNYDWIKNAMREGVPFNPTIGIGNHCQIVEVQCQREYEGKGAHPNYIAKGVIEGFEEYHVHNMKRPFCLNDVARHPNFAGVWTWSRGGGWHGPYIRNEFWCDLNTFIITQWVQRPDRSEAEVFQSFVDQLGFSETDAALFRRICLLSADGVLRGQYSLRGGVAIDWSRDSYIGGLGPLRTSFDQVLKDDRIEESLAERHESMLIWSEIEDIAKQLRLEDRSLQAFIQQNAHYGRMKYSIFYEAWRIMLLGYCGEQSGSIDKERIAAAIENYDQLWKEWKNHAEQNPEYPTLYSDRWLGDRPGVGESIAHYRKVIRE